MRNMRCILSREVVKLGGRIVFPCMKSEAKSRTIHQGQGKPEAFCKGVGRAAKRRSLAPFQTKRTESRRRSIGEGGGRNDDRAHETLRKADTLRHEDFKKSGSQKERGRGGVIPGRSQLASSGRHRHQAPAEYLELEWPLQYFARLLQQATNS
jgi:hypothetical protein